MEERKTSSSLLGSLVRLAMLLGGAYVVIVVLATLFQRKLQYFPDSSDVPRPRGDTYRDLEDPELITDDGLRLRAWYWPAKRPVTLVIFHGNAGHRGHRLGWIEWFHGMGLGVFLLDYRGYGGSEGFPTEEGLYRDGEAAWRWLAERDAGKLVYFGESLGCCVAVELARRHPPAALILQSGFSAAVDVARRVYPFLPVSLLMKDRYETRRRISEVTAPVLVIHGERDTIIPSDFGRALFDAAAGPKEWYLVPGADHNDLPWVGGQAYLERMDAFLRRFVE
jgi:fermentation-respiration switch protein FrsA (DUF1100 family)